MATIRKGGKAWQALIRRKGYSGPKSKTFATRKEAEIWARATKGHSPRKRCDHAPVSLTLANALLDFISGSSRGTAA